MKVVVDIDEVCLRWLDGFIEFLDKQEVKRKTPYPTSWDFEGWLESDTPMREWVVHFNWNTSSFLKLKPVQGAHDSLEHLKYMGYEIIAVTCCGKFAEAGRKAQLQNLFPNIFSHVHVLNIGASKKGILGKIKSEDPTDLIWFIDDSATNVMHAHMHGMHTFFMQGVHNRNDLDRYTDNPTVERIIRVESWDQIMANITLNQVSLLAGSIPHPKNYNELAKIIAVSP